MSFPRMMLVFSVLLAACVVTSLCVGSSTRLSPGESLQGALATLGLAEPLSHYQGIATVRTLRVLLAVGVGAALALSGGLLQGVFRNDLASPGIIGISAGASLGAACALLFLGHRGSFTAGNWESGLATVVITGTALIFALGTAGVVVRVATRGGRVSVPTLLLAGIAINAVVGGALTALQRFALGDYDLALALFSWMFGRLEDHSVESVALVWTGLGLSALVIPFVARELDLFATGEEDAQSLGVNIQRTKGLALLGASLAAATAVSVAGQIAFVGLVTPHLVRMLVGGSHARVLGLCLLGGPLVLLLADLLQRPFLPADHLLPPGVAMSLVGGVFFLFLLARHRRSLDAW